MLGIVIQARLGSKRLPNKMLLPFYKEKGVFEILIEKLKVNFSSIPIILATSLETTDDPLIAICEKHNLCFYRGSESNVLERFIDTAKHFEISKIIRICADNPFLDFDELENLKNEFINTDLDYLSYKTSKGVPTILTHFGFWAEAVSLKALQKVKDKTDKALYLEHVTNYIYSNPQQFKIDFLSIPIEIENSENIRMTLDTERDYTLLKEIYNESLKKDHTRIIDIVKYVSENNDWIMKMKQQIEINTK